MGATNVLVAVRGSAESGVSAALDARRELTVARRCAELDEAVGAAHAGIGAVVVVSEQPQLTRAVVAELSRSAIVVAIAPDHVVARRLEALGIGHVWAGREPADVAAQVAAIVEREHMPVPEAATREAGSPSTSARGVVIAIWGPTGAPGRTTVAVNLAAEIASAGREALIIDADTYGGAVGQACGMLDEAPGLAAVSRASLNGTLDARILHSHARQVAPHLRALTGITRPQRWPELPGSALEQVWEVARECADVVIVDAGFGLEQDEELTYDTVAPQRHGATLSALAAADLIVAVGSAEPLGVQRLIHGLESLSAHAPATPLVVVNRVRSEVAGPKPEQALADALARYAGIGQVRMLPWDPRAADAVTLAGQTLAERVPRSRLRKAHTALMRDISERMGWEWGSQAKDPSEARSGVAAQRGSQAPARVLPTQPASLTH
ncbi:AAA family ATPase [Demequina sediminicola]|uniref:AAA family ATPase n=1 Tax=Demequina sediminicola TaxID=1095026 RepID=UPI000783426B|nr:ParA family protein [Demequina sediminicola]